MVRPMNPKDIVLRELCETANDDIFSSIVSYLKFCADHLSGICYYCF